MKKVLIVDDVIFMRELEKNILSRENIEIYEASNGEEGVLQYKQNKPAVVLMDITMPIKGGVVALKEILDYDPDAKVIMVSALSTQNLVAEAITLGAKDFIVKPFNDVKLIEAINRVI